MTLEKSITYTTAEEIISWLQQDDILSDCIIPTVFDSLDQVDKLGLADGMHAGSITVSALDMINSVTLSPSARRTKIDCKFAVTIWTTQNATLIPGHMDSVNEYQSALLGQCLARLSQWDKSVPGDPTQTLTIEAVSAPFEMDAIPDKYGRMIILKYPLIY